MNEKFKPNVFSEEEIPKYRIDGIDYEDINAEFMTILSTFSDGEIKELDRQFSLEGYSLKLLTLVDEDSDSAVSTILNKWKDGVEDKKSLVDNLIEILA